MTERVVYRVAGGLAELYNWSPTDGPGSQNKILKARIGREQQFLKAGPNRTRGVARAARLAKVVSIMSAKLIFGLAHNGLNTTIVRGTYATAACAASFAGVFRPWTGWIRRL
jgi:hypothetical protein